MSDELTKALEIVAAAGQPYLIIHNSVHTVADYDIADTNGDTIEFTVMVPRGETDFERE